MGDEVLNGHLIGLGGEQGGEPGVADLQTAHVQLVLEDGHVLGILVAYLAALEASQSHFAHALLEGVLSAQVGQVVVGPADGGDSKLNLVGIQHGRFLLYLVKREE